MKQLLEQYLQAKTILKPYLATYAGEMAIFHQVIPSAQDPLWGQETQFGRIVYFLEWTKEAQRGARGTLRLEFQCIRGEQQEPEEMESILRGLLDGTCFTQETCTLAVQWTSSQYCTGSGDELEGLALLFTIAAFQPDTTLQTGLVERFTRWTKKTFPQLTVIGQDTLDPIWSPTDQNPAVFWSLQKLEACTWIPDTYQTDWKTATLQAYILAPSLSVVAQVARLITTTLSTQVRLQEEGAVPILVDRNHRVLTDMDPFGQGQVICEATFGLIKGRPESEQINHIFCSGKEL